LHALAQGLVDRKPADDAAELAARVRGAVAEPQHLELVAQADARGHRLSAGWDQAQFGAAPLDLAHQLRHRGTAPGEVEAVDRRRDERLDLRAQKARALRPAAGARQDGADGGIGAEAAEQPVAVAALDAELAGGGVDGGHRGPLGFGQRPEHR
jgi:hypothetical protein